MDTEKLITKIQALFDHAEGTDIKAERAVFLAKANELIEKYQISFHREDVSSTNNVSRQVIIKEVVLADKSVAYKWKLLVMLSISQMCFTHILTRGRTALIVGYLGNVDTTTTLYNRITQDLQIQMETDYIVAKANDRVGCPGTVLHDRIAPLAWKNTYLTIAAGVIRNRVSDLIRAREQDIRAIVVVNQDEIDEHIHDTFGIVRLARGFQQRIQRSASATIAGAEAGNKARIMEELNNG